MGVDAEVGLQLSLFQASYTFENQIQVGSSHRQNRRAWSTPEPGLQTLIGVYLLPAGLPSWNVNSVGTLGVWWAQNTSVPLWTSAPLLSKRPLLHSASVSSDLAALSHPHTSQHPLSSFAMPVTY